MWFIIFWCNHKLETFQIQDEKSNARKRPQPQFGQFSASSKKNRGTRSGQGRKTLRGQSLWEDHRPSRSHGPCWNAVRVIRVFFWPFRFHGPAYLWTPLSPLRPPYGFSSCQFCDNSLPVLYAQHVVVRQIFSNLSFLCFCMKNWTATAILRVLTPGVMWFFAIDLEGYIREIIHEALQFASDIACRSGVNVHLGCQ